MKVRHLLVAAALAMMLATHAPSQQGQQQALSKTVEKMQKAVARLDYTISNELLDPQQGSGLAICIDARNGTFLTNDVPIRVRREDLKNFTLTPAGKVEERIEVEFLGSDPETGLSFLKAPKGDWTALRFEDKANLQIGQRVVSVGLLGPNVGNAPYVGSAIVGTHLRLPHHLVMVTSGELTVRTSPV
ncbi:unnamed protein product, partial [marine sediment metagenome]